MTSATFFWVCAVSLAAWIVIIYAAEAAVRAVT